METIFVDVYEQYIDEVDLSVNENIHVMSNSYVSNIEISKIEYDIYHLIPTNKGDGFYIRIHSVGTYHFLSIFLMVGETCNIDFITRYFDSISIGTFSESQQFSELDSLEEKYYLSIDYIQEVEIQEIINLINENNFKAKLKSKEVVIFERGAGSQYINLLLEISTAIGGVSGILALGQYIKGKYDKHFREIYIGAFNFEELILKVSKITGVNSSDIHVRGFKREHDRIKVHMLSRYKDFEVICNKKLEIIEFFTLDKSQTMI